MPRSCHRKSQSNLIDILQVGNRIIYFVHDSKEVLVCFFFFFFFLAICSCFITTAEVRQLNSSHILMLTRPSKDASTELLWVFKRGHRGTSLCTPHPLLFGTIQARGSAEQRTKLRATGVAIWLNLRSQAQSWRHCTTPFPTSNSRFSLLVPP